MAKAKSEKKIYYTYEDFDRDKLLIYAGLDCIVTSELLAKLFPKIAEEPEYVQVGLDGSKKMTKAKSILSVVNSIEMKAHEYIIDMEINGIRYDMDANQYILWKMKKEIAELEERIHEHVPKEINLDSGKELGEFLYGKCGLEPPFTTKSGEPAVDGDAMLTLAGIDPMSFKYTAPDPEKQWLADLAKRRDLVSTKNTFIETYPQRFVRKDGRIHPSYNLQGTSSFRITGDNPNLTQLPRPKHGYNIRECYTVDEGNFMLLLDFSSAEVKILGALCKDPAMLQAIAEGRDFHSSSASAMIGVPYEDYMHVLEDKTHEKHKFYKMTRQSAKALNKLAPSYREVSCKLC
jgi:DNA polymerase-1